MQKNCYLTILVSIFFLIITSSILLSGEPRELVKEVVLKDAYLDKIEDLEEHRLRLWEEISPSFDFEEMSKRAMGKYWRKRSPKEKGEFVELFINNLKDAYVRKIYFSFGEKIISLKEEKGSKYSTVKTKLVTKTGNDISVIFRLLKKGKKWQIYDMIIEGVSVVKNYRSQINSILAESSYEELVQMMKQD